MERFIWKTGVRFDALPINLATGATDGQVTWAFINSLIDYEEERAKVHEVCLTEWETEKCPVCHKPIGSGIPDPKIIKEYEQEIYRPGEDLSQLTQSATELERRADLKKFLEEHGSSVKDEEDEEDETDLEETLEEING